MQPSMQENNELPTYSPEDVERLIAMCEDQQTENENQQKQIQTLSSDKQRLNDELQSVVQDLKRMKVENRTLHQRVQQLEQQSSKDEQLLLVRKQTAELEKANSTIQELRQQVQQLTEQNVTRSESDLQLKNASELKKNAEDLMKSAESQRKENEKEKQELKKEKVLLCDREERVGRRETAVSEREKNIKNKEKEIEAAADKKLKEQTDRIKEQESSRAKGEIEDFRRRYLGVFIVLSLICGAQLVLNAVSPVDYSVLQSRWELLLDTIRSIPTWSYLHIGITAAVTIAAVIFLGYQYFKRFFDEFTLFAVLADVTFIEYLAPVIVGSGFPLWAAFGIIQAIYIAVRDWNDENSVIKGFINLCK